MNVNEPIRVQTPAVLQESLWDYIIKAWKLTTNGYQEM
ncbi:hypothetical protein TPY_2663 [Sulfobacillus acidophilus TPY]|nr:hypothetical protein TPY_2663 [Sulfobacillus acidophilus TPY]